MELPLHGAGTSTQITSAGWRLLALVQVCGSPLANVSITGAELLYAVTELQLHCPFDHVEHLDLAVDCVEVVAAAASRLDGRVARAGAWTGRERSSATP
jgi:hypothetical protein